MQTGKYKTQTGESVEVLNFDESNNIAYVDFGEGQCRWVAESEFGTWRGEGVIIESSEEIKVQPTEPETIEEKVVLPDTTQVYVEPETEQEEEIIATAYEEPEEIISEVKENPIQDEKKKKVGKKKIAAKPAAKKQPPKKKGK